MRVAIYPGSFDPITNGHLDIIKRATYVFDKVIVAVLTNSEKIPTFTAPQRAQMIEQVCSDLINVEVDTFSGLLIDYAKEKKASVIIKGLRAVSDFEYEFQMALMNGKLDSSIETLFMMTNSDYSYLSSSIVRELAKYGKGLDGLVPDCLMPVIYKKLKNSSI